MWVELTTIYKISRNLDPENDDSPDTKSHYFLPKQPHIKKLIVFSGWQADSELSSRAFRLTLNNFDFSEGWEIELSEAPEPTAYCL